MSRDLLVVPSSAPHVLVFGRQVPAWAALAGLYLISRIVTTGILIAAYNLALGAGMSIHVDSVAQGFAGFLQSWDGHYYRLIAESGYPSTLPRTDEGLVDKNEWAFLPLYPTLVRPLIPLAGSFAVAAAVASAVFGLGATLMLHRLLLSRVGAVAAFWGAVFFCFGPFSFILQAAYAESLFMLLMFAALAAMIARRYLLVGLLGVLAAFAHPGALALAAALGLHALIRLIARERIGISGYLRGTVALAAITVAGFAWPVIVTAVTGDSTGYFDTEMAWWRDYVGEYSFTPFTPWFIMASTFLGPVGYVVVAAMFVGLAFWLLGRMLRPLGTDIRSYIAGFVLYLVAVFLPQQSIFRMVLPLSPLLGHPALSRTRLRRGVLLASGIALQPLAIYLFWVTFPP